MAAPTEISESLNFSRPSGQSTRSAGMVHNSTFLARAQSVEMPRREFFFRGVFS